MAYFEMHVYSKALGMQTSVNVIIPQRENTGEIGVDTKKTDNAYKCLYLLHGLTDDYSIWHRRTSIERYAGKYGICVVMPSGGKSFYTDMKYGDAYYTYIAKELPAMIREFFNVSDKREDNYIAGLSMGGYGALKVGLRECDKFCAAAGMSSVADIRATEQRFKNTYTPIFGDPAEIDESDDLFSLVSEKSTEKNKPRLFMAVGTEDYLYADNIRLKEHIEKFGYNYTFVEAPGSHNWDFWDEHIQMVLGWMFG